MRIGSVIGNVVLSPAHESLTGLRLLVVAPYRLEELRCGTSPLGEELVMVDELGAGPGSLVGFSEGREAAMPFHPGRRPIDASCACLLDAVALQATATTWAAPPTTVNRSTSARPKV